MITGYPRIEDFLEQSINLSLMIWDVKRAIFSKLDVNPLEIKKSISQLNGMELRILSIVYSAVLNDYYGVY